MVKNGMMWDLPSGKLTEKGFQKGGIPNSWMVYFMDNPI